MTLLTKAQFAERCEVTKQAIGHAARAGGVLAPAVVDGKINPRHKAAQAYKKQALARRATDATPPAPPKSGFEDDGSPAGMTDLLELRLGEVEEKFGGRAEFESWLKVVKLVEEVREKRLKNDETDGLLIERSLVVTHVFAFIEEAFQRLLSDTTKTLTRTCYANAATKVPVEKTEKQMRDLLTKVLDPMKRRVARTLRERSNASG